MKAKFTIKLGVQVKDKITGMTGIVVGRTQYLYGCNVYGVTPQVLENGKRLDTEWFDEGRLEVISSGVNKKEVQSKKHGGEYHEHPKSF